MRIFTVNNIFQATLDHQIPSFFTAFRTQINNVVSLLDDVSIVFYYDDGIVIFHNAMQCFQQIADIRFVESHGRLIQHVQVVAFRSFIKFRRQLYTLGLPTGECGGRLSQFQIAYIKGYQQVEGDIA